MSDLISRQATLEALLDKGQHSRRYKLGDIWELNFDEIREVINALPPADPQWIPCSERLPEYGVAVLTYDGHCFCVEKRIPTIRDEEGEPITGDWWVSDDYDEYDSDYYPNLRDGACIAWMPLPEPWKEKT